MRKPIEALVSVIERKKIVDNRGWFLKVINGYEDEIPAYTGEVYLTYANKGSAKGSHYHEKANEWFTLLTGECLVKLKDVITGESMALTLSENIPQTLFVPNNIAHVFINSGDTDFLLLAYSSELYNPADTIPFTNFD